MKNSKRILSFVLAIVLVLGLLPIAAMAETHAPAPLSFERGVAATLTTQRTLLTGTPSVYAYEYAEKSQITTAKNTTRSTSLITSVDPNIMAYCFEYGGDVPGGNPYDVNISADTKNNVIAQNPEDNAWVLAVMHCGYPEQSGDDIFEKAKARYSGRTHEGSKVKTDDSFNIVTPALAKYDWAKLATQLAIWHASSQVSLEIAFDGPELSNSYQKSHPNDWSEVEENQHIPWIPFYADNAQHSAEARAIILMAYEILHEARECATPTGSTTTNVSVSLGNGALPGNGTLDLTKYDGKVVMGDRPDWEGPAETVVTNGTPETVTTGPIHKQWLWLETDRNGNFDYWTSVNGFEGEFYDAMYFAVVSDQEPTDTKVDVHGLSSSVMGKFNKGASSEHAVISFVDPDPTSHMDVYSNPKNAGSLNYMASEFMGNGVDTSSYHRVPQESVIWNDENDSESADGGHRHQIATYWKKVSKSDAEQLKRVVDIDTSSWSDAGKWVLIGKVLTPRWSQDPGNYYIDFTKSAEGGQRTPGTPDYDWSDGGRPATDVKIDFAITTKEKAVYLGVSEKYQDVVFMWDDENSGNATTNFKWDGIRFEKPRDTDKGVKIHKTDITTGMSLPGAVFSAQTAEGCSNHSSVYTATTGNDGYAYFTTGNIPGRTQIPSECIVDYTEEGDPIYGPCTHTWTVWESQAPAGYIGADWSRTFVLTNMTGEVDLGDVPNGPPADPQYVTIKKVDADNPGVIVRGAWFEVKNIDTGAVNQFFAGNGVLTLHNDKNRKDDGYFLPNGSYMVTEYIAPNGYVKTSEAKTFNFELYGSNTGITLTFPNNKMPNLTVMKIDTDSRRPISGVTFDYWWNDQYMGTTEPTGTEGTIVLRNLLTGTYTFQEKVVPDNYVKSPEKRSIFVDTSSARKSYTLAIENHKKANIELIKRDANSKAPISGVTFDYWCNGNYIGETPRTDTSGRILLTNLETGNYVFKEKSVPETYIKTDKEYSVYVDTNESKKLYTLNIENYLKKTLVITKEDSENGWRLAGARFDVTGVDNNFKATVETDETGTAQVTGLVYGSYRIEETRAPEGYELAEPIQIVIDESDTDDIIKLPTFQDDPKPVLFIRKIDATTKQPIADVEFKVSHMTSNGEVSNTYRTDSNGLISIPDTESGWYEITEMSTPAGYVKVTEPKRIQITNTNRSTTVTFENYQTSAVNILKLDAQTKLPLVGAKFKITTTTGEVVAEVTTLSEGWATVTNLSPGSYVVTETEAPDHHVIDPTPQYFEVKPTDSGKTHVLIFYNNNKTNLYISKIDSYTKSALPGAVFRVTTLDGDVIADNVTTEENGMAFVPDLEADTVVVTEIKAPEGYLLSAEPQTIKVVDGKTITVEFEDDKPGAIAIKKVDAASNAALPGAVFMLYDQDDNELGELTTGSDGYARVGNLVPGYYTIREIKAPDGYQADMEPIKVKVDAFLTKEVVVTNTQKSSLTIEKRDKETNVLLPGAQFKVTTLEGAVITDALITGKTGTVTLNGLSEGKYYVSEVRAPDGYLLDTTPKMITTKGDEATIVTFHDQVKKGITINKVDAQSRVPLAGGTFEVQKQNGSLVGTYTTDTSGSVTTQALDPGYYIIREVQAPDGYDIGWTPISTLGGTAGTGVKVSEQLVQLLPGEFLTVTIPNTPKTALEIQKADSVTGKPLAGAVFTVTDERGNIVATCTTGVDGNTFTPRLEPGWYSVAEVTAPDGYILNTEPQAVKIVDGEASIVRFTNVPETSLTIIKADSQTGDPLPGAVFELKTIEGELVSRYETGENGTVTTNAVTPGKYNLFEITAPDGYAPRTEPISVTIIAGKANSVTVKNDALATLTVYKADSKNNPLPGATIKLETADGVFVAQGVTDSSGEIIFTGLAAGHYTATEIAAPTGYQMVSQPVTIWVGYNQTNRIEMSNAQWGGLVVKLTDQATGKPLPNGKFTVTHCADNSIVFTGTTDDAGTMMVGSLIPGHKYIVTQTMAPDGYTMTETEKNEFIVAGENKIVLFENVTAGIVIEKVDAITGDTLAGARFQLTRNSDNIVIGEYVTGTDGLALASGLIPGMYTVEEIKAPENYTIDQPSQLVHVKANETAHVTFKNTPFAGITMVSKDSQGKPLAGTFFEVYEQNGQLVNTYVTDSTGTVETGVLAPGFYVIKVVDGKTGYQFNDTERTVEIKNGKHVTETFVAVGQGTVNIYSLDASYKAIPGMRGTITKINGELVENFITDSDGMYTVLGLAPGWYVVTETKAPDNYQMGTASKNVLVFAGKPSNVYFTHDKNYGLQINTTVKQTGQPLEGVEYKVTKVNGEFIGTYTVNSAGRNYVPLEPGDYIVTPVFVPDGYSIEEPPKTVVVKVNKYTSVDFEAIQLSSIRVKIVDGETNNGVYGVRLLLKDGNGNVVKEYWTNNEGYITLSRELVNGDYILEQITVPNGYTMDTVPKSVKILNGETTEIVWAIWKNVGQIQAELRSKDYNAVIGKEANSLLYGGVFEIIDAVSYQVVDTMTTDVYGVAASRRLPLGRYFVKQRTAPSYYGNSDQVSEVTLKIPNDVVRVNFLDPSLNLAVSVSHKGNVNVSAGQTMRFDITEVNNLSTVALNNAYWTIKVPTDCARIGTFYTGSWNQAVWYSVSYKTNMADFRELAKNLNSTANNQFDLSSTALGLQSGEYVTEIRYEFGVIPVNFKLQSNPSMVLYVLPGVYNGYKLISRMELGGQYGDAWVSDTSLWTTNVLNLANKTQVVTPWDGTTPWDKLPVTLPKTGY